MMSYTLKAVAAVSMVLVAAAPNVARAADASQTSLLARGEYLATAGDCIACHTAPGGKPFAGGAPLASPFGNISPPNITPDKATGIGSWGDDDFYRALHDGVGKGGEYLYPAFPYPWYTNVTRDDVMAIKAYLFSLPAVQNTVAPLGFSFPFNQREGLAAWQALFFKANALKPDPAKTPEFNRGAYLVEGLGHCGECHDSNKLTGASKWSGRLKGGAIDGWYAPALDGSAQGLGGWTEADLVTYLKTGAAPGKGLAVGSMADTIKDSLSHLTDADLHAIAVYLKSIPANSADKPVQAADFKDGNVPGAQVYLDHCAFCHQLNGQGQKGAAPPLAGNKTVTTQGAENVIRVVLGGLPGGHGFAPMPAVGAGMTDGEVADVVNYVRQSWGNKAPPNAEAGSVGKLRSQTATLLAGNLGGGCPPIADAGLSKALEQADVASVLKDPKESTLLARIHTVLPKIKSSARSATDDQIVDALTTAFCPTAMAAPTQAERAEQIGNFSQLVWGALKQGHGLGG